MAPSVRRRGVVVTVSFATRRDGYDGFIWPHLSVVGIRMARIADHEGEAGE